MTDMTFSRYWMQLTRKVNTMPFGFKRLRKRRIDARKIQAEKNRKSWEKLKAQMQAKHADLRDS